MSVLCTAVLRAVRLPDQRDGGAVTHGRGAHQRTPLRPLRPGRHRRRGRSRPGSEREDRSRGEQGGKGGRGRFTGAVILRGSGADRQSSFKPQGAEFASPAN
jgi:hypothetical protein